MTEGDSGGSGPRLAPARGSGALVPPPGKVVLIVCDSSCSTTTFEKRLDSLVS